MTRLNLGPRIERLSPLRWALFCIGWFAFVTAIVWMLLSPARDAGDVWTPRTSAPAVETEVEG